MKLTTMKVPTIKYKQAREYQEYLRNNRGLTMPLWACLIDSEQQRKNNDIQKMIKRFI